MHTPKDRRSAGGFVIWIVLATLAIMGIVALSAFSVASTDLNMTRRFKEAETAFRNADGGVEYVLALIKRDLDNGSLNLWGVNAAVNYTAPAALSFDPVVTLKALPGGNLYSYSVTGISGCNRKTIKVVFLDPGPGFNGFFGATGMSITSSTARCSVGSNGNITLAGGATVQGDATPGPGGSVNNPGAVTGSTTPAAAIRTLPPIDAFALAEASANNNNGSISPTYYNSTTHALTVSAAILNLPAGTYYFSAVALGAGSTVNLGGPVTIYCTGPFAVNGGSIVNATLDPVNVRIFDTAATNLTYSSSAPACATVYAPNAIEMTIGGGGTFSGAITSGGKLVVSGGATLVGGAGGSRSAGVKIVAWKQEG